MRTFYYSLVVYIRSTKPCHISGFIGNFLNRHIIESSKMFLTIDLVQYKYTIRPNFCRHLIITPIYRPSLNCCHKVERTQFCRMSLYTVALQFHLNKIGPNLSQHDNAQVHKAWSIKTWFVKFGRTQVPMHKTLTLNLQFTFGINRVLDNNSKGTTENTVFPKPMIVRYDAWIFANI